MPTKAGRLPKINAKRIARIITKVEEQMDKEVKATISDYIRLLQMQSEFEKTEPKNIEVRWVDLVNESGSNAA